jgi:hypothetical protein
MKNDSNSETVSQYVAVFRGSSALVFPPGTHIRVNAPISLGTVIIKFNTRYIYKGLESPLPGDLWIDARGPAESIENAVSVFGGIVGSLATVISFSTNSAIGDLEPELVFNNTPGLKVRDFLQSMLPDERNILHASRNVNPKATLGLIDAIEAHPEKERISRAMTQYSLALRHWRWGHEILATAHLYIGMEALTKAVVRSQLTASGINDEQYARSLGINPNNLGPCDSLSAAIDVAVRKDLLFQGDDKCYRNAKAASDGFEHGFMPFGRIRDKARVVRDMTAAYLRKAILDLVKIEEAHREILLNAPYKDPLGNWPVVKYVRGQLLGDSDSLAAKGNEYPILSWKSTIKSAKLLKSGEYDFKFEDKLTPQLGEGISFKSKRFQVWKP